MCARWRAGSGSIVKASRPWSAGISVADGKREDMTKKSKLTHPGKILREDFMEPVGLSAYALAKALGVPRPRVNDIARERRAISAETAVLLSRYFGTTDRYWLSLQGRYDLQMARARMAKQAARIQPRRAIRAGRYKRFLRARGRARTASAM
jgi:addiction module HigA family antidote